ncbi:MAG: ABC transporter permease [Deltaproteobacteria bacterium]|nr:ABC transporter permease [Deltaproteobacteria bacterium]
MIRYLLRRIAAVVLILWAVSSMTFFVTLKLGDPIATLLGPRASARDREHVRRYYGLDQPTVVQYGRYMGRLVRGDLGMSYRYRRPVASLIAERFPRTLLLAVMSIVLEVTVGVALGALAAARRKTKLDSAIMAGSFLTMSMPTFITGKLFLLFIAYYAGLFPIGGYGVTALDHVYHAILPASAIALLSAAYYARLTRNELVEILQSDYIRTARAKGLSEPVIVLRHALRNALLPIVTSLGLSFGALFTGAIVTEAIFAWPGIGRLAYESISGLDVPVIVGCVIFGSVGIQAGNLIADLAYAFLDPRIRHA